MVLPQFLQLLEQVQELSDAEELEPILPLPCREEQVLEHLCQLQSRHSLLPVSLFQLRSKLSGRVQEEQEKPLPPLSVPLWPLQLREHQRLARSLSRHC